MRAERCVCCGAVIPEGMQVCPRCRAAANDGRSESQERIPPAGPAPVPDPQRDGPGWRPVRQKKGQEE